MASAGANVLVLSLNKPVWVRAYVPEPSLGKVHLGMRVNVITDSRPDKPYSGTVGFISPVAEFTPKNVETEALRTDLVYRLRIVVDDPDQGIRQGMPVTVTAAAGSAAAPPAAAPLSPAPAAPSASTGNATAADAAGKAAGVQPDMPAASAKSDASSKATPKAKASAKTSASSGASAKAAPAATPEARTAAGGAQ